MVLEGGLIGGGKVVEVGEIQGGAESDQNILKMYMKWLKGINLKIEKIFEEKCKNMQRFFPCHYFLNNIV